ncbi:tripartite tricarboxylate transporter TctB family protein [Acuticoccus mangrovi]|uniref:Tripartite tricarboxylate transporter TctB family protein n=1 Tax=Acuticoccus mangrovi TaxID=2796142 RepID=A0A934MEQ5_9HYPH|nr:tripartite tricarboxylate transporter TctB family protein [Acuticoccus mangrovi]MBJ3774628.1 tripartite tricarboxylate transporter TctB family protein [Acuticoccus mangrovi]
MIPSRQAAGDLALAAAVILVAVVVWIATADLPPPRYEPVGSAALPRGISAIMALLGALLAARTLIGAEAPATAAGERVGMRAVVRLLVLCGLTLAYVAAMDGRLVGFRPATIAYLFLATLALAGITLRRVVTAFAFAALLAVGLHALFTHFFYIDLP